MTVIARLETAGIVVEPGQQAVIDVTVHNSGQRVEAYRLDLVGEPAGWASVSPAQLSVYPGDDARAQVLFAPPRAAALPAGPRPFGVRVVPVDHPEGATVPEGVVELRAFSDLGIELTPRTSHGRGRARHELAVDNRGNAPVPVLLAGGDPDEAVVVRLVPDDLVVGPGQAAFAKVRVKPAKRRWAGQPVTHPFTVTASPDGAPPLRADGAMLAEPVLPRWLGKAVAAVLALAVLAAAAWFGLLRPAVKSAAQDAVRAPLAAAQAAASKANDEAGKAGAAAGQAKSAAEKASADTAGLGAKLVERGVLKKGEVKDVTDGTPPPAATPSTPFEQRLTLDTPVTKTLSRPYTVPDKLVLSITDLTYENPEGDIGTVTVRIDGDVLFLKGLANFRDDPNHYVSPIVLGPKQTLTVEVTCTAQGKSAPDATCRTALIVGGTLAEAPTA